MGSFASITGRIAISPPIPWRWFADSPYWSSRPDGSYPHDLLFEIKETTEHTDRGILICREAVAIVPHDADEMGGNNIGNVLGDIMRAHGHGRTFTGRIDVWWPDHEFSSRRYKIVDSSRVVEYEPAIAWPQESE